MFWFYFTKLYDARTGQIALETAVRAAEKILPDIFVVPVVESVRVRQMIRPRLRQMTQLQIRF